MEQETPSIQKAFMHAAEILWKDHHPPIAYPTGVLPVPEPILGTAFFPGGFGLWNPGGKRPLPRFPIHGVMIIGQDFDTEKSYLSSLKQGCENLNGPTWSNLLDLLQQHDIATERCFFTNLYMGLRELPPATGRFPGANDRAFVNHCRTFLIKQISVQRPSLVLTLGAHVPPVLGHLSVELEDWAVNGPIKLNHLDAVGPVRAGVRFTNVPDISTTVVALVHPSYRNPNLRFRQYRGRQGAEAESSMIQDGLAASGLNNE